MSYFPHHSTALHHAGALILGAAENRFEITSCSRFDSVALPSLPSLKTQIAIRADAEGRLVDKKSGGRITEEMTLIP
jgi:hypothetical protein